MSSILFVMLHPGFIRYYEDALQALAASGHDVRVAFEITRSKLGEDETARRLQASSPRISCVTTPARPESVRQFLARGDRTATRSGDFHRATGRAASEEAWESLATTVRLMLDYQRFFEPAFAHADGLKDRARKRLPRICVSLVDAVARCGALFRAALSSMLHSIERLIPTSEALESFVRQHHPDLLLVTPLIELGSQQVDYVKCARRLGIRSALCVASWDNLTSKGLIRVPPDHVIVWNEAQKSEAVSLHGVAPDRVAVTGAQHFDHWFAGRPSRSREDFCRLVGLDPGRPFVLYVGSSTFIAPDEVPFAERWIARLRASGDPALADAGILIRPHPANSRQWRTLDVSAFANLTVWPPIGTDPTAPDFKRDYFDSLAYCAAVVGINTSAQIEASILDRPVFTIRAPEFAHAQEGTLHFRYLVNDGPVSEAGSLDEHVLQLAGALAGAIDREAERRDFVRRFIRPHGLDVAVAGVFARTIDDLVKRPPPAPERTSLAMTVVRPFGRLMASIARLVAEDRPWWVYLLRPFITAFLWIAAAWYRLRQVGQEAAHTGVKRLRRAAWRVWYESSRSVGRRVHKLRKMARHAGGAAKRAVRREL